jgi:hypothetical protein
LDQILQFGVATRDAVLGLASLLKEPAAPGLFSAVMIIFLVGLLVSFVSVVHSRVSVLKRATELIRKAQGPKVFQESFEEIQDLIGEWKGAAAHHFYDTWKEFRETTIEARPGAVTGIRNALRPSVFFNLDEMGFSVSAWRFVPGFLVSIGLAATFLGLIAALQQTGDSLRAGPGQAQVQQAQVQLALVQLLTVASAKFIMSLTGLLCSIMFTIVLRVAGNHLESAMRQLTHEIEMRMNFVSLEDIAERQLIATVEQRDHMQKLNHDLIAAISKPLENALASNASHVGNMVQDLSASLSTGLAAAMDIASERLDAASGKLTELATGISSAAEHFSSAAERTAVGLDGAARRLEVVSDNLARAGSALADAAEPIVQAADRTATATQQIAGASSEMVESARKTMASERDLVIAAANSIKQQISSFEARAAAYDGQLEKVFKSFSEEIRRSIGEVETHSTAVHEQYADALSTLQSVIENAKAFRPESERPPE